MVRVRHYTLELVGSGVWFCLFVHSLTHSPSWPWSSHRISRADQSNTHFFTTHFYTTLSELGVSAVQNWTQRKGINVFDKKMVFFPINKNFHWSLAVAVNPGAILGQTNLDDDQPLSCILFFDSLRSHPKIAVAKKIRNWLNAEWKRIHNDNQRPFTESSMKVHSPKGE